MIDAALVEKGAEFDGPPRQPPRRVTHVVRQALLTGGVEVHVGWVELWPAGGADAVDPPRRGTSPIDSFARWASRRRCHGVQ